jgi:serine/threonine protein kinase
MGEVFLGEDPRDGRRVAIKTMHQHLARTPGLRERFRREVEAAGRIRGEFTAPVLEARTDGPRPWFAQAYIEGPTLGAAVEDHGPLPESSVRALAVSLCEALTSVHQVSVHRDLKPSNIILSPDGPRLIDFGIAALLDRTRITHTGHQPHTPGYAAPEYLEHGTVSPAIDVFSLGCVLVWAASGHAPFTGATSDAINLAVMRDEPDVSGVPDGLVHVLWQCLEKDPDDRLTLRQLLGMLRGVAAARGSAWLPDGVRWEVASAAPDEDEGPGADAADPAEPPAPRALHDLTTADAPGTPRPKLPPPRDNPVPDPDSRPKAPREAVPAPDAIAELNARLQEARARRSAEARRPTPVKRQGPYAGAPARDRSGADAFDAYLNSRVNAPTSEPNETRAPAPPWGWAPRVVIALVLLGLVTGVGYGLHSAFSGGDGGSHGDGSTRKPNGVSASPSASATTPAPPRPHFRTGALGTSRMTDLEGHAAGRVTVTGATVSDYTLVVHVKVTGRPFEGAEEQRAQPRRTLAAATQGKRQPPGVVGPAQAGGRLAAQFPAPLRSASP